MEQRYAGFWGRILRVNLTSGQWRAEEVDPKLYRRYMGGRSMALHFLLGEMEAGVDPLGPENKLILMTSAVTGAPISGQGRHTAAAKSPLTGGLADSEGGGWWGAELKFAGWDGIILEGRSPEPVYLLIEDDQVRLLPAGPLWGKTTGEADAQLKEIHKGARVLQIGPAGENLCRMAALVGDLRHFNARGGLGAVMGSKQVKAVVVRGTHRPLKMADPETLAKIAQRFTRSVKVSPALSLHRDLGTPKGVVSLSVQGLLPGYNFQDGSFDGAKAVSGEAMKAEIGRNSDTCYSCSVACKRVVEGEKDGFEVHRNYGGPEYETVDSFGPQLGVGNITAVAQCNELCNAYGLDTISTGVTIAWACECFERGLLTTADTGGIAIRWNEPHTVVDLISKMAHREGFGDLLAEGSLRAARAIGRGTERYAMQVKGQEVPAHEPRGKWNMGLGYAVSPTGADHIQASHDVFWTKPGDYSEEATWVDLEDLSELGIIDPLPAEDLSPAKVRLFVYLQYVWALHNVLDWCIFTSVPEFRALSLNELVAIVKAVTGWRTSLFEVLKAGERSVTMARAFNIREGLTAADDTLPERFFEGQRHGTLAGHAIDREQFREALKLYYAMMGWDAEGVPTRAKLEELAVGWIWEKLSRNLAVAR